MLTIQPLPAYDDNYIWMMSDAGGSAWVVDPGDAAPVQAALREQNLSLAGILITHHHFDHVGGVAALRESWRPLVYGPDNPAIEGIDRHLRGGDRVTLLGTEFTVLEVPGHTLDHIAYFHRGQRCLLFCGDTLFAGGCGRVFEGTPSMMHDSLQTLAALPADTEIYCAHEYTLANLAFARAVEPDNGALAQRQADAQAKRDQNLPTVPSTLAEELATNPFLRCDQPALLEALRTQGRLGEDAPAAVFATVRGWKDSF